MGYGLRPSPLLLDAIAVMGRAPIMRACRVAVSCIALLALAAGAAALADARPAGVGLRSCQPFGPGFDSLCRVWRDPDFDPAQRAFYYARVLENPTCLWSQQLCVAKGVDCEDPDTIGAGLADCCRKDHVRTIQERAWTSPIWYRPD